MIYSLKFLHMHALVRTGMSKHLYSVLHTVNEVSAYNSKVSHNTYCLILETLTLHLGWGLT